MLIALAARAAGRPVKWIEDRLEHLAASSSATNRFTRLEAAVEGDGRILALAWDQIEDCGAHLRAPEPATLYRMHGNMTGAYDIRHVAIRNRVVLTNKMPTGLNRGFGGPQVYFPLERLVERIARELGLDPLDGDPPQSRAGPRRFPIARRRERSSTPAITRRHWRKPSRTAGSQSFSGAATRRAPRGASTASVMRRWSSRAFPTWATSRRS